MEKELNKLSKEDQQLAKKSLQHMPAMVAKMKHSKERKVTIRFEETGESITVPKRAVALFNKVLEYMADGQTVSVAARSNTITTQQAATLLHVSRPYLVGLLERGVIPFTKVGKHRRVLYTDILSYQQQVEKEREEQLVFLAKQAQELNMGYD